MRRILILEDEYFLAEDCAQEVVRCGMQVMGPFWSADSALQLLADCDPDGGIIDINIRGDMEFAVAALLQDRGVPFVFYTGYGEQVVPQRFAKVVYLMKPTSPTKVVRELLQCMNGSQQAT